MLIDAELGDVQSIGIGQRVDRAVHRLLGSPPGDPEAGGHSGDGPAVIDHGLQQAPP